MAAKRGYRSPEIRQPSHLLDVWIRFSDQLIRLKRHHNRTTAKNSIWPVRIASQKVRQSLIFSACAASFACRTQNTVSVWEAPSEPRIYARPTRIAGGGELRSLIRSGIVGLYTLSCSGLLCPSLFSSPAPTAVGVASLFFPCLHSVAHTRRELGFDERTPTDVDQHQPATPEPNAVETNGTRTARR